MRDAPCEAVKYSVSVWGAGLATGWLMGGVFGRVAPGPESPVRGLCFDDGETPDRPKPHPPIKTYQA